MNAISAVLEPGNPILGVFGYLDATLTREMVKEAAVYDLQTFRQHETRDSWPYKSVRHEVREIIHEVFRLQYRGCPLRKALVGFRLYYRGDMADALTSAYFLLKRGDDPIKALVADYCLRPCGLLAWEDIDKIRSEARSDDSPSIWGNFSYYHEEGDRLIRYDRGCSHGYLLVRGDRLVWEYESLHVLLSGVSLKRQAELAQFDLLGGNRGFLAGEFIWPPDDWVNPVSDEEEMASLKRGFQSS